MRFMKNNEDGIIRCKSCDRPLTTQDIFIGDGKNCLSCNYRD